MDWVVHQKIYLKTIELRGIDSGNEVFQIRAITHEEKECESGEDGAVWWRPPQTYFGER